MAMQYRTLAFSLIGAAGFFTVQSFLPIGRLRTIVSRTFYSVAFIVSLMLWGYYFSAGSLLNASAILAIFQTNLAEAKSYLLDYMPWQGVCILLLLIAAYVRFLRHWTQSLTVHWGGDSRTGKWLMVCACIALTLFSLYRTRDNFYKNLVGETQKGLQAYRSFTISREARAEAAQNDLAGISQGNPGVYILVIGESQNRLHMSAYGYDKETTPWLDQMKNDAHTVFFTDARSCHTHTVPVLSYALTDKNQYNQRELSKSLTLIEAAKAAGFHTVWLSNQVRYGAWDTPTSVIADEADEQVWLNGHVGETTDTNVYDGNLVDSLKQVKATDKTLIVIHLMGNHGSYRDRYPQEFSVFAGDSPEALYDNSIRYNDFVVQNIYEAAKAMPNFQGLVYCSDHADDVDRNLGHDASHFTQDMTKIPFYMIFSDAYEAKYPGILQELRAHKDNRFTNDLLYNAMLGIMGIVVPADYEEQNDLTSADYNADKARFRTLHGQQELD